MLSYSLKPQKTLKRKDYAVQSFISDNEDNIDWATVNSFGEEWEKFDSFGEAELQQIGNDYFDLVDDSIANDKTLALDVGCGSGRWARYLSSRVQSIEAIDPSHAAISACIYLKDKKNVRVTQASVNNIPFENESFDLVYSLGVLHHLPDTSEAIGHCKEKLKRGGWLLLYLYYDLDNRGLLFKAIFQVSAIFRKVISRLPQSLKHFVCDVIAATIYLPAALICRGLYIFPALRKFADALPLSYYRKTSFHIMRNDALDRFGTPLEKRFSREQIEKMLKENGLANIRFSNNRPYWHVISQRI